MSPPPLRFDTEELLAQIGWVRELALRVASDAHVAEDLTQDTLLVALRGRESGTLAPLPVGEGAVLDDARPASLRRWLAAVVRNLGRTGRRSARRRSEREAALAHQELPPSTLELIERAATQRELVGALLELDEPYRSTLLMRFFEDRSRREIAERTGVPVSTVGTRIAEGLKRLRRRFSGRETWLSSILPFFPRPQDIVLPALISGAAFVSVQTKLILGAVVIVGGLIAFQSMDRGAPVALEARAPEEQPRGETELMTPVETGREVIEVEQPPQAGARPAGFYDIPEHAGLAYSVVRVRGRVVDIDGSAVGGVEVCRFRPRGTIDWTGDGTGAIVPAQSMGCTTADESGRFETEGPSPFMLNVRDEHYTTLFEGVVSGLPNEKSDAEILVIVAPRIPLGGVVVDEHGAPIEGVRVTSLAIASPPPGNDLSASSRVVPEVRTDELGVFELDNVAAVEDLHVQFLAPGFVTQILPVPEGGDGAMVVEMSREAESLYAITGHVVLADGSPAVGAHVSTGVMAVPTDERGFFVIDFEPWLKFRVDEEAPTVVTAISPGLLPASLSLPSVNEARETGWPEEIVLELSGEPLTIRGIVVDEEGQPMSRVLVEPADMSEFGIVSSEGLPAYSGIPKTQEQLVGGGATHTGEDGRFVLKGLLDRSYSICALRKPSLLCVVGDPVHAGDQNVRIVLDRNVLGTIAGRIVDRHGQGVRGVRIAVSRKRIDELVIGSSALTDDDGAFRITDVTTQPEFLRIEGPAIVPELFRELGRDDDVTNLELKVGRRCRIQLDWGEWPGRQDELFVVDERDQRLMMMRLRGSRVGEVPSVAFQAGPTDVLVVSDEAARAIVTRDGQEVTRVPLNLLADELNSIRL